MGDNLPYVNLGTGRKVKSIAGGDTRMCAILDNDQVKCWGWGYYLGIGITWTSNHGDESGEMGDGLPYINLGTHDGLGFVPHTAKKLSMGATHTCAILDDDRVKCWGENDNAQHGKGWAGGPMYGTNINEMGDNLQYTKLPSGRKAVDITCGNDSTFIILDNGSLISFGYNGNGELGVGHTNTIGDSMAEVGDFHIPVSLHTGLTAKKLAKTVHGSTCAILSNDRTKCWGASTFAGGLGIHMNKKLLGAFPGQMAVRPNVSLPAGSKAVSVKVAHGNYFEGYFDTHVLLDDGSVLIWGSSWNNRGNNPGTMGNSNTPSFAQGGLRYKND